MEIKYTFVNGEETSIEIHGDFEEIMIELDRNLYNNNQTETRRHISLNAFDEDRHKFADSDMDLEKQILNRLDRDALYKAISKLKPDEQELIHKLYLNDKPMTQKQCAEILGVTENAVQLRLAKIKKKLKHIVSSKYI